MTILWTRTQLKDSAKERLKAFYWKAFLVCLIAALLGAGTDTSFRVTSNRDRRTTGGGRQVSVISVSKTPGVDVSFSESERVTISTPLFNASLPAAYGAAVIFAILLGGGLVLALGAFFSNIVQVGKKSYFLKKIAWDHEAGVGELFSGFKEGYINMVTVMFRRGLSIFLWSLLLFIPGIIKSYEYYMVPYLLAENPHLSWEEARDLSRDMMEGNKFDLFVLELSFIGWDIAGALLCGVGQVFVFPYKEMVYAELYHTLSQRTGASTFA